MPKRAQIASPESSDSSYLRRKKPVPVRRKVLGRAGPWLLRGLLGFIILGVGFSAAYAVTTYFHASRHFLFSNDQEGLRISGLKLVDRESIQDVFRPDAGSSVFSIPLEQRRAQIREIAWVEKASVRRVVPNRIWVQIQERRPVAFVRFPRLPKARSVSPKLIDREGVLLSPPAGEKFMFPVLTGISVSMPLPDRAKRVALYQALMADLDAAEPFYSSRISEVDVVDPRNAKLTTVYGGEMVQLQMGNESFRHRYEIFLKYFDSWKKEFGRVRTVDLRYKGVVATE